MTTQELSEDAGILYDKENNQKIYYEYFIQEIMIKFAKYHVEQALKAASKKANVESFIRGNYPNSRFRKLEDNESYNPYQTTQMYKVNKKEILNSYNLTNIK
jgi:hypothetical protein